MSDNVIDLPVITTLDLDPKRVLARASERSWQRVIVVGVTVDGAEFFASSASDGGTCLWDLERAKHKLIMVADDD